MSGLFLTILGNYWANRGRYSGNICIISTSKKVAARIPLPLPEFLRIPLRSRGILEVLIMDKMSTERNPPCHHRFPEWIRIWKVLCGQASMRN